VQIPTSRFLDGLATGVVLSAGALLVYLATVVPEYRDMLEAFGGEMPALTRLVVAPGFVGSVATASIALAVLLNATGQRFARVRPLALAMLAIATVTAVVAVYVGMQLPIRTLADPIR
jgi:hypothetical protein